jgi:cob(I)alamin adenosyltransferase
MTITTKTGDSGQTQLFGGKKVSKGSVIINLIGNIDKLQALMGIVIIQNKNQVPVAEIRSLQKQLSQIMGHLSGETSLLQKNLDSWLTQLENKQKNLEKTARITNCFYLPGQNQEEAWINYLRTEIRACERLLCYYCDSHKEERQFIVYFNRLSDYFFVLSQKLLS